MLPKHGGFSPRAAEIRFGAAVTSTELEDLDAAEVRQRVLHLRDAPMARRVSPVWQVVSRRACSRAALAIAFAWGVAEALSWPVIAEMSLVLFAVAVPRRILPLAIERATRIVGVGAVLTVVANALHPWLRRFYGTYLMLATTGFIAILAVTVERWS